MKREGGEKSPPGDDIVEVEVPAALAGERVDRALSLLTGRSRGDVAELVATGAVRLSGTTVSTRSTRVREGERLRVELAKTAPKPLVTDNSKAVPYELVFKDDELLVVNKPAGVVVHPGAGHRDDTLIAALVARFPELQQIQGHEPDRPGVVHRLDKDTSGLLVVARTARAHEGLSAQLRERTMGREYLALVLGETSAPIGVIDAPIGRSSRNATRMAVTTGGRNALTRYELVRVYFEPATTSLLRVRLDTGRTHQIRVHLAAIGHPVAGDARYGGSRALLLLRRPFLHAARLSLRHPLSGEPLCFEAPLPTELEEVLARLS